MHDRLLRDQVYRESHLAIGWTEQKCKEWDELAKKKNIHVSFTNDYFGLKHRVAPLRQGLLELTDLANHWRGRHQVRAGAHSSTVWSYILTTSHHAWLTDDTFCIQCRRKPGGQFRFRPTSFFYLGQFYFGQVLLWPGSSQAKF